MNGSSRTGDRFHTAGLVTHRPCQEVRYQHTLIEPAANRLGLANPKPLSDCRLTRLDNQPIVLWFSQYINRREEKAPGGLQDLPVRPLRLLRLYRVQYDSYSPLRYLFDNS